MKKLVLIIITSFICTSISYADRLGIGQKKVDFNLECNLDVEMLKKAGFPQKLIENLKKTSEKKYAGFKKFELPGEQVLLSVLYSPVKKEYIFPSSTVLKLTNNGENDYLLFTYGGGMIFQSKISILEKNKYFLLQTNYEVDKSNIQKFDKLLNEMNKLPDNEFVVKLGELTTEYDEFVLKKKNNHTMALPYICNLY